MKRFLTIAGIITLSIFNNLVYGCSCFGISKIADEIGRTDLIFSGKVLSRSIELLPSSINIKALLDTGLSIDSLSKINNFKNYIHTRQAKYVINIKKVFKGKIVNDTIAIYSRIDSEQCGYQFKIGENYLVYAIGTTYYATYAKEFGGPMDEIFFTNTCTRTQPFSKSHRRELEKSIKKLNKQS